MRVRGNTFVAHKHFLSHSHQTLYSFTGILNKITEWCGDATYMLILLNIIEEDYVAIVTYLGVCLYKILLKFFHPNGCKITRSRVIGVCEIYKCENM